VSEGERTHSDKSKIVSC